jgi:hydrogenase expression/formation protein HypC
MKLVSVAPGRESGVAETGGVSRPVRLDLVEAPEPGDYVLIHAGYAIQKLSPAEAEEALATLREFIEAGEEGADLLAVPAPDSGDPS